MCPSLMNPHDSVQDVASVASAPAARVLLPVTRAILGGQPLCTVEGPVETIRAEQQVAAEVNQVADLETILKERDACGVSVEAGVVW